MKVEQVARDTAAAVGRSAEYIMILARTGGHGAANGRTNTYYTAVSAAG